MAYAFTVCYYEKVLSENIIMVISEQNGGIQENSHKAHCHKMLLYLNRS